MIEKLKREWKTFTVALVGLLLGLYEAGIESGADWTPFLPEKYRPFALPVFMTLMLLLRRYRDKK